MMKYLLCMVFFLPALLPAQINKDSLWAVWEDTKEADTVRLQAIKDLIQYGYLFSQPDTAFVIAQTMYDYAVEQNDEFWMDAASNYQGISMAIRGRHTEAIGYFDHCLELSKKLDNKSRIAGSLNNIGLLYKRIEDNKKSLEYLEKALVIYEEIADTNGLALCLGNIGILHGDLGNTDKQLPITKRSFELYESMGDKKGIGNSLSSLGGIYASQGDTARVNGQLDEANKLYEKALANYNAALGIRKEAGDRDGIAVTLHGMGMIYGHQGKTAKSIKTIEEALAIAEEVGSPTSIRNATGELHYLYKSQNRYKEALEMLERNTRVDAELLSQENQRAVIRQEYEYEFKADSLAKAEEALQVELAYQQELRRKDNIRDWLIMLSALILLISFGLWSRNRYIKSANKKLEDAKDRAERSEKYKEQFLANMSHEIRTPMHAISGMVNILKRNDHPAAQDPYLEAMKTSSDNLVVILNDVLDLSKIEAGQLEMEQIPMNPRAVLNNVLQILQYKAEEKGLRLEQEIDADLPPIIMGDPTRLNQILTNLISNAIKFTEQGRVLVSLKRQDQEYRIEVTDTGIGIDPKKLDNIFEAFTQAAVSTNRHFGGTGLGLNISKQLIELHQGRIWAKSTPGKGSSFFVQLPLRVASDTENLGVLSKESVKKMAASLKGIRILLAEDNEFNKMIATDDLVYHIDEVEIKTVKTGLEAVENFQTQTYDLILMDVQMPDMNGLEASKNIRDLEATAGTEHPIPIIAMTASLLKSEIQSCIDAGMNSYIPKPYKIGELIGEIYKAHVKTN